MEADDFKARHRQIDTAFTRVRRLPFAVVLVLVMRNSVKSLQNVVNEAMSWLKQSPVTASAYSQARYKLKHTAFIELNQTAVVETVYGDGEYRKFWGFRLLAVDGSKLALPDHEAIRQEFGTIRWTHGKAAESQGERPYALASVLYDVLNRIALDARLDKAKAYEIDLAVAHLAAARTGDLWVMDRHDPAYRLLAELSRHGCDFAVRCSAAAFAEARRMLQGEGPDSQRLTLTPCAGQRPRIRQRGLPLSLDVRLVRVRLRTGEYEVLVTSLLEDDRYPTAGFQELYRLRWGIESFYGLLKTRLELENFTGIGVEAIRQDFHATVYLSGLESLLTGTAQAMLEAKATQYPQTVNRAVSFNAVKHLAWDLLLGERGETDRLLEQLTALFLTNPCLKRSYRNPPCQNASARVLLNFHKRQKKHCF